MNKSKHFLLLAAMLFSSHVAWGLTTKIGSLTYFYTNNGTEATVQNYDGSVAEVTVLSKITVNNKDYPVTTFGINGATDRNKPNLVSITLPESIKTLSDNAFDGCTGLKSINIPDAVTSIGVEAFQGCSSLTSIALPEGITSIPNYAFDGCTKLQTINIKGAVTSIGSYAFRNCSSLTGITLPTGITAIPTYAFSGCTSLKEIVVPNGVKTIGTYAFNGCNGLDRLFIPASVTTISNANAFAGCTGTLEINCSFPSLSGTKFSNVIVGNNVASVPASAFRNLTTLKNVTLPNAIKAIPNYAFDGCTNLERLVIPASVTSIGNTSVFSNCSGTLVLNCGYINNMLTAINNSQFSAIELGENVASIPADAFSSLGTLKSVTIRNSNPSFAGDAFGNYSGALTIYFNVANNQFQGKGFSSLTISEGVESIGDYAFSGCNNLTSIVLPSSITQLGDQSFSREANLTSVDLSKCSNLETLPLYLFAYNPKLSSVSLPNSIKEIQRDVFLDCTSLASIVLPENLKTIGTGAFNNTSLSSVSLPDSVKTVMDDAFINCKSLKTVTFNGPVETIAIGAFIDCTNLTTVKGFENTKVTEVPNALFRGCTSLNDITLPSTITRIGEHAFQGSQLTSIDIPASVTSIESTTYPAFEDCSKLEAVTLHSLPTGLEFLPQSATITMSLTDASNVAAGSSIDNVAVTYTRAAGTSTWGTICLPFATQSTDDVTLYQLTKVDMENGILTVEAIEGTIAANTPCLYKKVGDVGSIVFGGNGSVTSVANPALAPIDGWTPKGTYQKVVTNQIYYISRNEFHYATETASITINPFRAWFEIEDTQAAASRRDFKIAEWEASTGVSRMLSPEENEEIVYNLFGQQLGKARVNEINIVNGKKCLVK